MLGRGDLIVLGLDENPQFPKFPVQVLHKFSHPGLDRTKIVIFQLLSLGRHGSEQRPPAEHQVLSLAEFFRIHQKIFLLRSNRCDDAGRGGIAKQAENPERLFVDHFHGAEQRRLFIQRLPAVRTEDSGNAEGVFFNKSVGRRVPGRIASGDVYKRQI